MISRSLFLATSCSFRRSDASRRSVRALISCSEVEIFACKHVCLREAALCTRFQVYDKFSSHYISIVAWVPYLLALPVLPLIAPVLLLCCLQSPEQTLNCGHLLATDLTRKRGKKSGCKAQGCRECKSGDAKVVLSSAPTLMRLSCRSSSVRAALSSAFTGVS